MLQTYIALDSFLPHERQVVPKKQHSGLFGRWLEAVAVVSNMVWWFSETAAPKLAVALPEVGSARCDVAFENSDIRIKVNRFVLKFENLQYLGGMGRLN